jgi:hypothetical protein
MQAYISIISKCTISSFGVPDGAVPPEALGCAFSYVNTEALAEACVDAFATAWAGTTGDADKYGWAVCDCGNAAEAQAEVVAFFTGKLFAQVQAEAVADIYGENGADCTSADGTVEKSIAFSCIAKATAAVTAKASAQALLVGQCSLYDQAVCGDQCTKDTLLYSVDECAKCRESNQLNASASAEAVAKATVSLADSCTLDSHPVGAVYYWVDGTESAFTCTSGC